MVSKVTFCPPKKDTIAAWKKKYHSLNTSPSNIIVLKFHMLLLYIYHQTVSVGESRYQIMYIFKL